MVFDGVVSDKILNEWLNFKWNLRGKGLEQREKEIINLKLSNLNNVLYKLKLSK